MRRVGGRRRVLHRRHANALRNGGGGAEEERGGRSERASEVSNFPRGNGSRLRNTTLPPSPSLVSPSPVAAASCAAAAHYCTALTPSLARPLSPSAASEMLPPCLGELIFREERRRTTTATQNNEWTPKRSFPNGRTRPSSKVRTNEERERQTHTDRTNTCKFDLRPPSGREGGPALFQQSSSIWGRVWAFLPSLSLPFSSYAPFADCHSGGASEARGW